MSESSRPGINHLFIAMSLAIIGFAIGLSMAMPVAGAVGGVAAGGIMLTVFTFMAKTSDP